MAVFEKSSYICYFIFPVRSKLVNIFHFLFKSSKTHPSAAPLLPTEGGGGGGIFSHTTIVLAATLTPLKLWLPNFVTSCFYLFPQFEKILAKSIGQGGC